MNARDQAWCETAALLRLSKLMETLARDAESAQATDDRSRDELVTHLRCAQIAYLRVAAERAPGAH
jgi:hypothetical protein